MLLDGIEAIDFIVPVLTAAWASEPDKDTRDAMRSALDALPAK